MPPVFETRCVGYVVLVCVVVFMAGLLASVPGFAAVDGGGVPATCHTNALLDGGILFTLLDDTSVTANMDACQGFDNYLPMSPNWVLADTGDVSNWDVAKNNYWSTQGLVNPGPAGGWYRTQYAETYGPTDPPGQLGNSSSSYLRSDPNRGFAVDRCNLRILLQHRPCPNGTVPTLTCAGGADNHCSTIPWEGSYVTLVHV